MSRAAERPAAGSGNTVLIIGAGVSGLTTAARLLAAGVRDIVVLERDPHLNGSRSGPHLPGHPSDLISLLDSTKWAGQPGPAESSLRGLIDRHQLGPHVRFGQHVTALTFDEGAGRWTAMTRGGERFDARSVVLATGLRMAPQVADLRGLDHFGGTTVHTARWDPEHDFSGKRVAVIGTGATAVQIVPELVKQVNRLKVFQRTARWTLPGPVSPMDGNRLFAAPPFTGVAARRTVLWAHEPWALSPLGRYSLTGLIEKVCKAHLRHQVSDRWMRRLLTPDSRPGDRPLLVSNDYYRALQRPNCELVAWPIATISEAGIRTADAVEHRFDTIVLATGRDPATPVLPFSVTGRSGVALADAWAGGALGYKGVNVAGFPNMFVVDEPQPGLGDSSASLYLRPRIDYAVRAITTIGRDNIGALDVTREAQERNGHSVTIRPPQDPRSSGGRYRTTPRPEFGSMAYPATVAQYTNQLAELRLDDYSIDPAPGTGEPRRATAAGGTRNGVQRRLTASGAGTATTPRTTPDGPSTLSRPRS